MSNGDLQRAPRSQRCGDTHRGRAADILSTAMSEGRITLNEFDERTSAVWNARTFFDLEKPLADLMEAPTHRIVSDVDEAGVAGSTGDRSPQPMQRSAQGARSTVVVLGGTELTVPEDVNVYSEGLGLMGGFSITEHPSVTTRRREIPADAPVIRIQGTGFLGGVELIRKARNRQ